MSTNNTRRNRLRAANAAEFRVRGMNGETRSARFYGYQLDHPIMEVWDEFAPIRRPVSWGLVKAIGDGKVAEFQMKAMRPPYKKLGQQASNLRVGD